METLTIKIRDSKVLKLLHDLETLGLIEVIKPGTKKAAMRLSETLSGCISAEQGEIMHKELREMRG
jgi:hypothetical protein